jgi:hypothetical protein
MTDPDPAGALASSQRQQEKEDEMDSRGDRKCLSERQDLTQSGTELIVNDAERTERMQPDRDATCAWDCQLPEGHLGECSRQRAADSSSASDLGAALGRLRLELDALKAEKESDAWHRGWKVAVVERDEARADVARLRHLAHQLEEAAKLALSWAEQGGPADWRLICKWHDALRAALTEPPA